MTEDVNFFLTIRLNEVNGLQLYIRKNRNNRMRSSLRDANF